MTNERLKWVSKRLEETYESKISKEDINQFINDPDTIKLFNDLFTNKEINKLFVHYQPESSISIQVLIKFYLY